MQAQAREKEERDLEALKSTIKSCGITVSTRWSEAKDILKSTPSFAALNERGLAQKVFEDHLNTLEIHAKAQCSAYIQSAIKGGTLPCGFAKFREHEATILAAADKVSV